MDKWYHLKEGFLFVDIKAVPGASKTEIAGAAENRLRIRIAAAPEDGKANAELVSFLSKKIGVPKRDITVISGDKSRLKTVRLPQEALQPLLAFISS